MITTLSEIVVNEALNMSFSNDLSPLQWLAVVQQKINELVAEINTIDSTIADTIQKEITDWMETGGGKTWMETTIQNAINSTLTQSKAYTDEKVSDVNGSILEFSHELLPVINYDVWRKNRTTPYEDDAVGVKECIQFYSNNSLGNCPIYLPAGDYVFIYNVYDLIDVGNTFIIGKNVNFYSNAQKTARRVLTGGIYCDTSCLGGTIMTTDVDGHFRLGDSNAWLEKNYRTASEVISQMVVKSNRGNYGIIGASQTKDNSQDQAMSAIGVGAFGINNNATKPKPAWGEYVEVRRYANTSTTMGIEIDAEAHDEDATPLTPYNNIGVYDHFGQVANIWCTTGSDNNAKKASCAMALVKSNDTGKWGAGIVVRDDCLDSNKNAMLLPRNNYLRWHFQDSTDSSRTAYMGNRVIDLVANDATVYDIPTIRTDCKSNGTPPDYIGLQITPYGYMPDGTPFILGAMVFKQKDSANGRIELHTRNADGGEVAWYLGDHDNTLEFSVPSQGRLGTIDNPMSSVHTKELDITDNTFINTGFAITGHTGHFTGGYKKFGKLVVVQLKFYTDDIIAAGTSIILTGLPAPQLTTSLSSNIPSKTDLCILRDTGLEIKLNIPTSDLWQYDSAIYVNGYYSIP